MRELKLRYLIELISDIGAKSTSDAQKLTDAQRRVREALDATGQKVGTLERLMLRMGGVGSASAERQANYLARLALRYQDVRKAAEGAYGAMEKGARIAAGVAAGAYTADRLTQKPMDYSMRLARMANTAFSDRDAAGRIQGKALLDAAVRASVRTGGGSIDDAAATLDSLIASGAVPVNDAIKLMPSLMKASTASGAPAEQLGTIGVRAMQSFKIPREQIGEVLNMAMVAGQAGGFELKDMAKWLPQAMAAGGQSGLSGVEGFRRILASFQASVITGGTKDEAGNNLVNLLAKINSNDTAKDFSKLGYDLPASLAKARGQGVNSLDAFVGFVDKIAAKDPAYVALQKKLAGATSKGDKSEVMESMASILQGKAVGQVIQDRQALMALIAEMNNRGYVKSVMDKTRGDPGAIDTAFGVIGSETGFKREQALNEATLSANDAFAKVAPALNAVFETGTNVAREFPLLSAAAVGATGALTVFAAALGGSSLIGLLTGGRAGAGMLGTVAGGALGMAAKGAGVVGAGAFAGYELAQVGGALSGWYNAAVGRDKVTLTPDAQARLPGAGQRPDYLSLTGPTNASLEAATAAAGGSAGKVELGQGQIDVKVTVSDDRASGRASVTRQLERVNINSGNTNPGGYVAATD